MQENFIQSIKVFITNTKEKFENLDKSKKFAIVIGIITVILAAGFSINYSIKNKYGTLFSGLDVYDAANISKALEDKGIDTKIDGDTIYVPREQVDKLRLELSPTITNGSKGFELMDEGSNLSMTDEEFQIKKLRMLQGELEKTIKTFTQVEDARVHITQGKESVFSKDSTQGKAAVYVALRAGSTLDESQIKSIISLISASSTNIPKQNIEVIDQNMSLLSEGIYDENGNAINSVGLATSRMAERELGDELRKSLISMLEPVFGKGKVAAIVNANLNFDTVEKSEIKIDPDKVIKSEIRSENSTSDKNPTGSPVDNNMSNTTQSNSSNTTSKEEKIEYEVGKTETRTITTSGEVKRITASVAIDGYLPEDVLKNVEDMVSSAIGIDTDRGDKLSVVAMEFNKASQNIFEEDEAIQQVQREKLINIAYMIGGILLLIIVVIGVIAFINKKIKKEDYEEESTNYIEDIIKAKEIEDDTNNKELSLEDEIKVFASNNPEKVTELIKTWLNE